MRNIIPVLKSLGLLESEVKTYLATLELGPSTVLEINKKIGLSRQAIYTAIESLITLGLMSSVEKGKKTLFAAESPERLRSFAETKLKKMESTVREIKDITKDLSLVQQGEKPIVRMYEGNEGIKAIFEDIIKTTPKHIDEFTNERLVAEYYSDLDLGPLKEKLDKLGTTTNLLAIGDPEIKTRKTTKKKLITNSGIKFNGDISIYDSKVSLASFKGKAVSVIIESEEIAQTLRSLFKLAWDNEKK